MDDLNARIDDFVRHFEDHRNAIRSLGDSRKHLLYRKQLNVALLDTLSRSVLPKAPNRDRFVGLIRHFGSWKNGERVSLPHLAKYLAQEPEPAFQHGRRFVSERLSRWVSGGAVPLNEDPSLYEIEKLWPSNKERARSAGEAHLTLDFFQHVFLLYRYRNYLVHEFRAPGYPSEDPDDREPHYQSTSPRHDLGRVVWELCYPVLFLEGLVDNCLSNVSSYLRSNRLDPYRSYAFGSYWLEQLNT